MKQVKMALYPLFILLVAVLTGCGGGGGGSTSGAALSGVASKGPINHGRVHIYAVDPATGARGAELTKDQTIWTDEHGNYSASVPTTGSVIVEVVGGTYADEATSTTKDNPGLRAVVPNASGTVKVAVTPLTEVAFKMMSSASGKFSATNATRCNGVVSTAFGVDIIGTQPVDATDATKVAAANTAALDYAVALAAISKMSDNQETTVADVVSQIQSDLSGETPKLSTTGTALSNAVSQMVGSGKLDPAITPSTISVGDTITFFKDNTVNPPVNPDGVAQAKALVHDLRNTVLSVVNYDTGNVASAIKTPFDTTAQEIQTKVAPELTSAGDLIGWVVNSMGSIQDLTGGTTYTFTDPVQHPNQELTITTAADSYTATVTIMEGTNKILDGTMSVDDINAPTSGTLNFTTIKTLSGNSTLNASFAGSKSGTIYTSMVLKGKMTTPVATFDFSDSAPTGKISATFSLVPGTTDSVQLTSMYFKGVASTASAKVTGIIDVPTLVRNTNVSTELTLPSSLTISGTIQGLSGSTAVLTITGSLSGTFSNAATYNPQEALSATNFPIWSATFNGSIVASSGLNITALLKASMPQYQTVNFEAKYTRILPDGSTIFLGGTGTYNTSTRLWTANLTNQNGMQVALSFDATQSKDQRLSGTIKTSGGATVGNFSTMSGVPRVTYADDYFETLM